MRTKVLSLIKKVLLLLTNKLRFNFFHILLFFIPYSTKQKKNRMPVGWVDIKKANKQTRWWTEILSSTFMAYTCLVVHIKIHFCNKDCLCVCARCFLLFVLRCGCTVTLYNIKVHIFILFAFACHVDTPAICIIATRTSIHFSDYDGDDQPH